MNERKIGDIAAKIRCAIIAKEIGELETIILHLDRDEFLQVNIKYKILSEGHDVLNDIMAECGNEDSNLIIIHKILAYIVNLGIILSFSTKKYSEFHGSDNGISEINNSMKVSSNGNDVSEDNVKKDDSKSNVKLNDSIYDYKNRPIGSSDDSQNLNLLSYSESRLDYYKRIFEKNAVSAMIGISLIGFSFALLVYFYYNHNNHRDDTHYEVFFIIAMPCLLVGSSFIGCICCSLLNEKRRIFRSNDYLKNSYNSQDISIETFSPSVETFSGAYI